MSGEVIAEREYRTADGAAIKVSLHKPRRDRGDWACDAVFEGALERRLTTYGVDSVQALFLALQSVATELYIHEPAVHWFTPGDELGLPTVGSIGDLKAARFGDGR